MVTETRVIIVHFIHKDDCYNLTIIKKAKPIVKMDASKFQSAPERKGIPFMLFYFDILAD